MMLPLLLACVSCDPLLAARDEGPFVEGPRFLLAADPIAGIDSAPDGETRPSWRLWLAVAAEAVGGAAGGYVALVFSAHHGFSFSFALQSPLGEILGATVVALVMPLGAATAAWLFSRLDDQGPPRSYARALAGAYLAGLAAGLVAIALRAFQVPFPPAAPVMGAELIPILLAPAASGLGAVVAMEWGTGRRSGAGVKLVPSVVAAPVAGRVALGPALRGTF